MAHIGLHRRQAEFRDHLVQLGRTARIGGDLSFQIGDILVGVARGVWVIGQEIAQRILAELALIDQHEIVEQHPLLVHRGGKRRHRPRRRAADIGMMPA